MIKDWLKATLEDLCIIGDGNHSSKYPKKSEMVLDGIPFIRSTNLIDGKISNEDILYISEEKHQKLKKGHLTIGDVLFTNRGEIGKVAIVDKVFDGANLNSQIAWLRCREELFPKYLFYFLQSDQMLRHFSRSKSGAALQQFTIRMIKEVIVSYPPLLEQKRIVAILDEVFEGIDRAIANTEKNLTNARELFESYLNEIFTQKGDGWVEKRLSEIGGKISTGPFGSILHKSDYVVDGIPIVNPANIEGDEIIPNFNKTIDQDMAKKLQSYILKKDDVVVGRRGEIGRCAVVREEQSGWLCGSGSFFIKPFENVDSVFLAHLIRSATYRNKLEALSTGATMLNLSNQSLSDLIIGLSTGQKLKG